MEERLISTNDRIKEVSEICLYPKNKLIQRTDKFKDLKAIRA